MNQEKFYILLDTNIAVILVQKAQELGIRYSRNYRLYGRYYLTVKVENSPTIEWQQVPYKCLFMSIVLKFCKATLS